MAAPDYRERLTAPITWWLLGALFVIAVWWAFFVATPLVASVVAALVAVAVTVWTLGSCGSVAIRASERGLQAGRATLPWSSVGSAEALDRDATRRILGVEADARAYLLVRAYCPGSIKITLDDPVDPTPYWLVSTRRPEVLAAYVRQQVVRD